MILYSLISIAPRNLHLMAQNITYLEAKMLLDMQEETKKIFVYGTLMHNATVKALIGRHLPVLDDHAILDDYEKQGLNIRYHSG